jgi:predicted DNA-binding transcriptional regulator AlpA
VSSHLVGITEIAEMIGVSRQRVAQLAESYEDFPKPEADLAAGRIWSRTAIEAWIQAHPERPTGRPERSEEMEAIEWEPATGRMRRRRPRKEGMFERFTDFARGSIVYAQEEARLLRHNYIGTEHLLLGLIRSQGIASEVLARLEIEIDAARGGVERLIGLGTSEPKGHIPFTPRAKKMLELSLREATQLGHNYIGTEHIVLGMIREGEGVGARVLESFGLELTDVRRAILRAMTRAKARRMDKVSAETQAAAAESAVLLADIAEKIARLDTRLEAIERKIAPQ